MAKGKSFSGPKGATVKKGGQIRGMKNSGGTGTGRVTQPSVKPHKGKTNP